MKEKAPYSTILVRMPNWLGDAVMATPILKDLRTAWPDATITALCQGSIGSLLIGNPHLDKIFSFTRPNEFLRREEGRQLITKLRQGKYDLGILLPNSFSSAWWFWRGGVRKRLGFATHWRRWLLTDPVPLPPTRETEHLVTTYKRLLLPLGIPLSSTAPELFLTDSEREGANHFLRQQDVPFHALLVGIHPGAAYGSAKCWFAERFRAVIERLLEDPRLYILCFGDQASHPLLHAICSSLPSRVLNLAGMTSLRELLALIQRCDLFLTNDSGPMHVAAAFKVPLVALFGSTSDVKTGPYQHGKVIHKHVICSPCYQRVCPRNDIQCLRAIEVEEVYNALLQQLEWASKHKSATIDTL